MTSTKFQIISKIQFPKFQFNNYSPQRPALMEMGDAKTKRKTDQKHILAVNKR